MPILFSKQRAQPQTPQSTSSGFRHGPPSTTSFGSSHSQQSPRARNLEYEKERRLFIKRMEEILLDRSFRGDILKRREQVEEAVDHLRITLSHDPLPRLPEWSFTNSMLVVFE
uniref:BHLH domain-containing protein n=1 Tax=Meloidogyne hapla TaxID=6305 RepID=A0A1I8BLS3_MELHA